MEGNITKRYLGLRQEEILEVYDLAKPLTEGLLYLSGFFLWGGEGGVVCL